MLRFQDVERIRGIYIGEIHSMWFGIRTKEPGRTGKKTLLTEAEKKFLKAGVYFVEGYLVFG